MVRRVGDSPLRWYSSRIKRITFQWRSVSGAMPSSLARVSAISGVHSLGSVMNPSLSNFTVSCTGLETVADIVISLLILLAGHAHLNRHGHAVAFEQNVPINPAEH